MRTHILLAGLVAGAVAAPAASARPIDEFPIRSTTTPTVTRVDSGFDWGSAGVGAGGAAAALLLAAGAVTRRRVA